VFIKCFKFNPKLLIFISSLCFIIIFAFTFLKASTIETNSNIETEDPQTATEEKKDYIKWFEFNVTYNVLEKTSKLDIDSHKNNENVKLNWIELISYLACKYGNDFSKFKQADLDKLVKELKSGKTISELTEKMKLYSYYFEGYDAVLHEFIGEYKSEIKTANSQNTGAKTSNTQNTNTSNKTSNQQNTISSKETDSVDNSNTKIQYEDIYGIKAFHPIAKNYGYSHYDDFGASRSYGYNRLHFGNDLMGSIGTPIIAVESGIVEATGWNQYGGWRIGIRSFDKKRYYYYAHLRKNHPYSENMEVGKVVQAGDVIGYLGMTGYSTKENVNNINVPHLHFGIQLIFDEVQKEGPNQIWVDLYDLVDFLKKNRSEVYKSNLETKDYSRKYQIIDPIVTN